jgi:hypothetical protein
MARKSSFSVGWNGRRCLIAAARKLGYRDAEKAGNIYLVQFCMQRIGSSGSRNFKDDVAIIERWLTDELSRAASGKPKQRRTSNDFYKSWEWRTLRMEVLKERGARCECCGATRLDFDMSGSPVKICVDHIKAIATHPHLRLVKSNLQVLCDECNQGKGAWDNTDWRGLEKR